MTGRDRSKQDDLSLASPKAPDTEWRMTVPLAWVRGSRARLPNPARDLPKLSNESAEAAPESRRHEYFSPPASQLRHSRPLRAVSFLLTFVVVLASGALWIVAKTSGRIVSYPVAAGAGWIRQELPRGGMRQRMTIYESCGPAGRCRMELKWRSDLAELQLVRSLNSRNYDLIKLRPADGAVAEERFSITGATEKRRSSKIIAIAHPDPDVRVAFEVSGANAGLYLENELTDAWREDRLAEGSVGLVENRGEKTAAHTIRFIYPDEGFTSAASLLSEIKQAGVRIFGPLASHF